MFKCGNKGYSEKFCNSNKKGSVIIVQQGEDEDLDGDVPELQAQYKVNGASSIERCI